MSDIILHPSIAEKYEVTKGFVQRLNIPGIGYRDLAYTPLHVVESKITAGIIPGLQEKKKAETAKPTIKKKANNTNK